MIKRKNTFIISLFIFFTVFAASAHAQKPEKQKSVEKQRKEFLQLQDDRDAELSKKMGEDREKHVKIQTKETQKRMKKNRKKMRRRKEGKHEKSFFERLFTKKPH
ncbi:hypothetical protein G3O08_10745 [Cryomorpha ignava]|uniref:DUF4890 domain-containing protein n=1 Tax=Cryomorpha ignava TaxID=101383 RepID=A0A7K3WQP4_9FLAO|nr:hypothetical protein [Cryomorpha ignava]NEN23977.1 hypothetical protein [Cryomorpha ignava]